MRERNRKVISFEPIYFGNLFIKKKKALNETIISLPGSIRISRKGGKRRGSRSSQALLRCPHRPLAVFPRRRRRLHFSIATTRIPAPPPPNRTHAYCFSSQYSYIKLTAATPHLGRSRNPPSELAPMAAASSLRAAPFAAAAPVGSAGLGSA